MAAIAVDVGTTLAKALLYDEKGREVAIARRSTTVHHPKPGHSEQDMWAVWRAVRDTITEVRQQADQTHHPQIEFIAVTAQGDGCWLVDDAGEPTGPAVLWNDARAAGRVDEWRAKGLLDAAFHRNGSLAFSGLPHAILDWLRDHDPDRLKRSALALTAGGWVFSRLTGAAVIDESDAAVPFLDLDTGQYDEALLGLYGMSWVRSLLPEVVRADGRTRRIDPTAAHELQLAPDVQVVLAPYDVAATAIGVGVLEPGQSCSILGTTLCTETVVTAPDTSGNPGGLTLPSGLPGRFLRAFPTLAGTESIRWACDLLRLDGVQEFTALASESPPGAGGVRFLPYLSPAGERAPFLDPDVRGRFAQLSFEISAGDIARAVLEGLTYSVRECLDATGVAVSELRVCGGGSANTLWLQLLADASGVPVLVSSDSEAGARGAWIMGRGLLEGQALPEVARDCVTVAERYEPESEFRDLYDEGFAAFLAERSAAQAMARREA